MATMARRVMVALALIVVLASAVDARKDRRTFRMKLWKCVFFSFVLLAGLPARPSLVRPCAIAHMTGSGDAQKVWVG